MQIIYNFKIINIALSLTFYFGISAIAFCQEPPPSPSGQQPSISGSWYLNVQGNEITEAGKDFIGTYESATNQVIFNRNVPYSYSPNWSITVHKTDIWWHSNMKLWIRRTGDGTGVYGSTISNGANYQEVLNTPVNFFKGYKEVNEIPLQLKISGISVIIPSNTYYTLLNFTITEY